MSSGDVTPAEYAAWSLVAQCETGSDWAMEGPVYSGALGISNLNWGIYGGAEYAPNAGEATPDEQIIVAERIQPEPPDQGGCTGSW